MRPFGRAAAMAGFLARGDSVAAAYLATGAGLAPDVVATVLRPEVVAAAAAGFDVVAHLDGHVARPPGPPCVVPPRSPRAALARALSAIELGGPVISGALRDTESAATASGLAVRTPFLDHRLFEWVATGGVMDDGAPLLRVVGAAVPLVAAQRLRRPMPPLDRWMRSTLRPAVEDRLFADDPDGVFVHGGIDALWSEFLAGRADWRAVWTLAIVRGWIAARRTAGVGDLVDHRPGRVAA
jgi:hypothetical protein